MVEGAFPDPERIEMVIADALSKADGNFVAAGHRVPEEVDTYFPELAPDRPGTTGTREREAAMRAIAIQTALARLETLREVHDEL